MIKHYIHHILAALCLSLISISAFAKTPWYQVEILVFANDDPEALDDEFWPANVRPPLRNRVVSLSSAKQENSYKLIPQKDLLFLAEKRRIQGYQGFRILFHNAWRQPVMSKRYAKPVRIRGGDMLDNGQYELDGFITIDRGRYLHFRPDLYLNRQLNNLEQNKLMAFESPQASDTTSITNSIDEIIHSQSTELTLPDFLTVQLNQGRRMRSKEVHYIDHPLMGVLVLMLPLSKKSTN